jgi:hypothetical protein
MYGVRIAGHCALGALTWPNGFDLDPIALYDRMVMRTATPSSCPALCRASTTLLPREMQDVDGRDKPGHDGR